MIYPIKLMLIIIIVSTVLFELCGCGENKAITSTHKCSDSTHLNCDGECSCDGMECRYEGRECPDYATCKGHSMRDYQIDLHNDTVWVYDGQRLVERYVTTWKGQIDSALLNDNQ